jgi:hypothetical protein
LDRAIAEDLLPDVDDTSKDPDAAYDLDLTIEGDGIREYQALVKKAIEQA